MKVLYEYDLDDKDNTDAWNLALTQNAQSMYTALDEISLLLRGIDKGYQNLTSEEFVRQLRDIINESTFNYIL